MQSKQKIQTTRFSKAKTATAYFVAGHYLMCSSLAYAGHGFGGNDGDPDSKKTISRPLNNSSNEPQENNKSSSSYFSSFQDAASSTFNWLHESALDSCERFGKWVASYAEDLPPSYFAKSLLEIDYVNDELFWKGHFNQELEDIKEKPYLTFQDQARLNDLQYIVWNGLLAPYVYEKKLRELEKQSFFSGVRKIKSAFQSKLKSNPEIVLQYLRKDLLRSLEAMQNKEQESERALLTKFEQRLTYYRNALNAFDYAETLACFLMKIEMQKEKLALSTIQHEGLKGSLKDVLLKINKIEYVQIKEERQAISFAQKTSIEDTEENSSENKMPFVKAENSFSNVWEIEDNVAQSYFSYPFSFVKGVSSLVKRGISFTIENPVQAITMGLAYQAAAVAARSPFSSLQQFRDVKDRLHHNINTNGNNFSNREVSTQNVIDLANFSSAQGFMVEGATTGDQSGWSVSSAGDFNGDGVNDVIIGAITTSPLGRHYAGSSYVIYGQQGRYPAPIDLALLYSTQGVIINGAAAEDNSGASVSSAGDFNGDGIDDVIVGALGASPQGRKHAGISYVIYGQKNGYSAPIDLGSLNATQGLIIEGASADDNFGSSVNSAGDFNGDGVNDVIIGATAASPLGRRYAGATYIIYGKKGGHLTPIDLASLDIDQGVIIEGAAKLGFSGNSVSSVGDFNGDELNDVIIGAALTNPVGRLYAGSSYVIYGKKGGYLAPIDLAVLNLTQGVIIEGEKLSLSGWSVSSAGDFNNDGVSDVIIGAPLASNSYVIYGEKGGCLSPIDLASLNSTQGVIIKGARARDDSGCSVSSAGDFNGDGLNDVIVGALYANTLDRSAAGSSYVIYGQKGGYLLPIDLATLNATQGVIIEGAKSGDWSGNSVSTAGDFNDDGINDVIVGALGASPLGRKGAGASYVIYGSKIL